MKTNVIELHQVVKVYGLKKALDGLTMEVAEGSVHGLIGPNGAGKTTTFSILAGFIGFDSGRVSVLGFSPRELVKIKGRIGVMPQDALFPSHEKVGEFLVYLGRMQGLTRPAATEAAREALKQVGGDDWWTQRCGGLSHGMAKRVSMAQAILGSPKLLLLDEPTAGLDPKAAFTVRDLIKGLAGRYTTVISSHNLHELEELCTDATILDGGRLIASGSMATLTSSAEEVSIVLAPKATQEGKTAAQLWSQSESAIRQSIPCIRSTELDVNSSTVVIYFDPGKEEAEEVIAKSVRVLLDRGGRISGVTKGRKLESRVRQLTT